MMSGSNSNLQPLIGPKLLPSSEGKREEEERGNDTRTTPVSLSSDGMGLHGAPAVGHASRPPSSADPPKSAFTTPLRPSASPRSMVPQPVHPVTSLGMPPSVSTSQSYMSKPSPMASLIRGSQHLQPCPSSTTHLTRAPMAPTYSSHVPRGPAAVASITPPRAAVATPIVRPPHSQLAAAMSQAVAATTTTSLHSQMQSRPPLSTVRTLMPTVTKSLTSSVPPCCISDSHRLSTLSNVATIQMAAAAVHSDPLIRSAALSKPVHVSQPIMQTVQQVPEKNYYKPILGSTVTVASPAVVPIQQQTLAQPLPQMITMATSASQANTLTMPVSSSSHIPLLPAPTSHTQILPHSHVVSSATQMTGLNLGTQTKLISQTVHTVAPLSAQSPSVNITSVAGKPCISSNAATVVPASLPRQSNAASIPVAKVHPQPVPVSSRPPLETLENSAVNLLLPPAHRTSPNQPTPANVSDMPASVVLMEPQQERSSVSKNGPFTVSLQQKMVPSTTYYYEPYQNNLSLSSYGGSTSSFTPLCTSSSIRPGIVPSHPTPSLTATMQTASRTPGPTTLNPVMVAIDPNRPLALHSSYTSPVENSVSTSEPSSSSGISSTVFTVSTSGSASSNFIVSQPPTSNSSTPAPSSASPRPSILRKRTSEGANVVVRKNLLTVPGTEPVSPHPDCNSGNSLSVATSPKPSSELSREGGVPSLAENGDSIMSAAIPAATTLSSLQLVSVKTEPASEAAEAGLPSVPLSQPTTGLGSAIETSPRKKPRKQQLTSNELMETHSTDAEEEFEKDNKESIPKEIVREDEEGVRWVATRQRPPITLLNSYRHTWKSRHNHFLRYSDVRPKERRPTVHDLANQKGVLQKVSGWKIHHLCTQLDEVVEMEDSVHGRLAEFLSNMEQKNVRSDEDKDMNKVNELIKGNLQRCRLIRDQMREARQQVLKVVEHKPNISEIVTKFISKRPIKKRDRN